VYQGKFFKEQGIGTLISGAAADPAEHPRRVGRCPLIGITDSRWTLPGCACSAASKCHRLVGSKPERFKEVRPGNDDGVPKFWRNWRGHDDVMQTRSIRGSGEPVWVIALLKCALTIGTRSAQSIMASGFTAAQKGRPSRPGRRQGQAASATGRATSSRGRNAVPLGYRPVSSPSEPSVAADQAGDTNLMSLAGLNDRPLLQFIFYRSPCR
jgi:hypothetical protein